MSVRSNNFTSAEVEFLLNLVENYKYVIECKKTDRINSEEKAIAWKEIEIDFNSKFGQVFRNAKVLKTKYENIKKVTKKNLAIEKGEIFATGGGTKQSIPITSTEGKILSICQSLQIAGDDGIYDDDIIEVIDDNMIVEIPTEGDLPKELSENLNETLDPGLLLTPEEPQETAWKKYTPSNLRQTKHRSLKINKRRHSPGTWDVLLQKRQQNVTYI